MTQPESPSLPEPDMPPPTCPGDDQDGFRPLPCGRDEAHMPHPLGVPPMPRTLHNVHNQRRVIT